MSLSSLGSTPPTATGSTLTPPNRQKSPVGAIIGPTAPQSRLFQTADEQTGGAPGPVIQAAQNPLSGPGGAVGMNSDPSVGGSF